MRARATAIWTIANGPSLVEDSASTVGLSLLRVVERLVLAGALLTATRDLAGGALLAIVTTVLHVGRSLLAVRLRISRRVAVETRASSAILAADPMAPLAAGEVDLFATFLEGTELVVRLLVDLVPDAAGDALAAVLLTGFVVSRVSGADFGSFAVLMLVAATLAFLARRVTAAQAARAWEANGPFWRQLRAVLGARHEIVATGATPAAERALERSVLAWAQAERRYRMLAGLSGRAPWLVVATGIALAFLARWHGGLDAELLRECSLFAGAGAPLAALVASLHEAAKSEPVVARFLELTGRPRAPLRPPARPLAPPREIVARGVGYRYDVARADALSGASFVWRRGRIFAIGGANGTGKSTLLRLLLRLAPPSAGSFTVDGAPWSSIADQAWRESVAYVAQVPYLDEEMTVRELVRLLAPEADDAALEAALRRVDVWDRLAREPEPLAVQLRLLSAGMRQRVVLARALAQDRPILLLDEPDASLDADGVERLAGLLRELSSDRLVAVVAHAPALLAAADDRVVLSARTALSSSAG